MKTLALVVALVVVLVLLQSGALANLFPGFGARPQVDPTPPMSAVGTPPPTTIQGALATAITNPNAINHLVFGVGTDTFKQFNELTDVVNLGQNMCDCYHGNEAACKSAREQAPGLRCKSGDCDCHITDVNGQIIGTRDVHVIHYHDSKGGPYTATVGRKVPVGGCQAPIDANVISNRTAGYCG